MNPSRNRALLLGAALVPVVLLAALLYVRSRPLQVGDLSMLPLEGWRQGSYPTSNKYTVTYRKMVPHSMMSISVACRHSDANKPPQTIQELQNEVVQRSKLYPSRTTASGKQIKSGVPRPIQFHGLPAVEWETFIIDKNPSSLMHSRSIDVVSGNKHYLLNKHVSTTTPPITPAMEAELDKAFEEVTQSVHSS